MFYVYHLLISILIDFHSGGAAYVFRTNDGGLSWSSGPKLAVSGLAPGDMFGGAVAVYEDIIVVGAQFKSTVSLVNSGIYIKII